MVTIAEIEDAIIARLKDKGLQAGEIDAGKGFDGIIKPAVLIEADEGKFEKVTAIKFRQTVTFQMYVFFKHAKNEKERRRGVYPILQGIVGILTLQDLGLGISPLRPTGFRNVTTEDFEDAGVIVYRIGFETSFTVEMMAEEAAYDLLKVGLEYYLTPGDSAKDAEDVVSL